MNMNQQKKYSGGYKGGGLKKGEVNELRAKVQEQAETIAVLHHMVEQEAAGKFEVECQLDELQARIDAYNVSSFLDKLIFIFSDKKL